MDYFADEYLAGRTPNPCVQCNNWIKFGKLFDYADSIGASHVATGHYARILDHHGTPALFRGVDADKDQSYVLFGIAPELLPRMLLPIGGYTKAEIRRLATDYAQLVARKKDSQEICFVDPGQHAAFVSERAGSRPPGTLVTMDGAVVGQHEGVEHFTIGQRKGLGVAMGTPHYVVRIDADANQVVVGPKTALARRALTASDANWFDRPAGFEALSRPDSLQQPRRSVPIGGRGGRSISTSCLMSPVMGWHPARRWSAMTATGSWEVAGLTDSPRPRFRFGIGGLMLVTFRGRHDRRRGTTVCPRQ